MALDSINTLLDYLIFRLKSKPRGGHGIHSPFVFDLYTKAIDADTDSVIFEKIEKARKEMLSNPERIIKSEFGAGSKKLAEQVAVGKIARTSCTPAYLGRLLYRLVDYFKPSNIVELGTSLGLSAMYLAAGNNDSKVVTIEGDKNISDIAIRNFKKYDFGNISAITGNFSDQLPEVLRSIGFVEMAFIDGDHSEDATINYFNLIKGKIVDNSVIIIDDIRWSKGMKSAWSRICSDKDVAVSIDLFRCGVVIFRKGITKQHFSLRFGSY